MEGSGRDLRQGDVTALPTGAEENHENLSHDSRSPGRDLNPVPPEYEA
jgi:hypothetical protein